MDFDLWNLFQAVINSTITPSMTFTKTSQKFGQWSDVRANTVYGLGFSSEAELTKVPPQVQLSEKLALPAVAAPKTKINKGCNDMTTDKIFFQNICQNKLEVYQINIAQNRRV